MGWKENRWPSGPQNRLTVCGILFSVAVVSIALGSAACHNTPDRNAQAAGGGVADTTGFSLRGQLTGISSGGVKLVWFNQDDRISRVLDSLPFTNGSFALRGRLDYPEMMSVMIEPGGWSFPLFLENSSISITADTAGSEHFDYSRYGDGVGAIIKKVAITGSQSQDDWLRYQNDPGQKQFEPVFTALDKEYKAQKDIDGQYRVRDRMDSVRQLLMAWQQGWISRYIGAHPSATAGAYMLTDLYQFYHNMPLTDMEALTDKFTGEATSSVYYKNLRRIVDNRKALLPGALAPDFTLLKRDSSAFTLSSTRGKYMMIDFWASWCHPCRQAIPHWKEIYNKYHAKGFDIVSVSDDNRWKDWFKAMDQEKMPWTQVDDEFPVKNMPARVGTLYMTAYIPFYLLLDKEGRILLYTDKEAEIDAKLKELLG